MAMTQTPSGPPSGPSPEFLAAMRTHPTKRIRERIIVGALGLAAAVSLVTTAAIIIVLVSESIPFFRDISIRQFLFTT